MYRKNIGYMMLTFLVRFSLLCALALAPLPLYAQAAPQPAAPEPQYPVITVGVLSYLQYDAELENRQGFNAFDVTRTYLNVNAQVAKNVRFRFTPDIRRATDSSLAGTMVVRVKYAFAQLDNVAGARTWVRAGMHQTPWLDFEESVDRYRVQGQMFAEREGLIPGSADVGASTLLQLPKGFGEVHAGIYNGEGYAQAEVNKYKSVQARLTVRPFANRGLANGLRVSGFYNAGWYAADRPRRLGIVMGSFEHRRLVATLQRLDATENPVATSTIDIDRSGWSAFVEPRQGPAGWAGVFRVDRYDPDNAVATNTTQRVIAGGAYWFTWPRARIGLVATNEHVRYDAPTRLDENRVLLQAHIEF